MNFGSLFSGIGGMDLGLERAGMTCKWQVEIDDYATRVLAKHWPAVPRFRDVREVGRQNLAPVDLICGGFPCQDISIAGDGSGLAGKQSGLWSEFYRIICELRPCYVFMENVPTLCSRGLGEILGQLSDVGYDAEWHGIPAAAIGAVHLRARQWVLAYPTGFRDGTPEGRVLTGRVEPEHGHWWSSEPRVCRVDDGTAARVDRLKGLGNAVVPQVAEWIGKRIMVAATESKEVH